MPKCVLALFNFVDFHVLHLLTNFYCVLMLYSFMFYVISSKRLLLCVLVDLHAFTFFDIQIAPYCRYPSLSVIAVA